MVIFFVCIFLVVILAFSTSTYTYLFHGFLLFLSDCWVCYFHYVIVLICQLILVSILLSICSNSFFPFSALLIHSVTCINLLLSKKFNFLPHFISFSSSMHKYSESTPTYLPISLFTECLAFLPRILKLTRYAYSSPQYSLSLSPHFHRQSSFS